MIGIARFHDGAFTGRVTPNATYVDAADAQCTASGWAYRASMTGFKAGLDYLAVEFNDDDQPTVIYPRKGCPKR